MPGGAVCETGEPSAELEDDLAGGAAAVDQLERLARPVVGARYPLERAGDALELIDGRGATGKVVLDL